MGQLNQLGGQPARAGVSATYGQVQAILQVVDPPAVSPSSTLVEDLIGRLSPLARNSVIPPGRKMGARLRAPLTFEATYRIFSALGQGAAPQAVLQQAQIMRQAYAGLVLPQLMLAAREALNAWADKVAGFGQVASFASHNANAERRDAMRAELARAMPNDSELRDALARAGAVDLYSMDAALGFDALLPEGRIAYAKAGDYEDLLDCRRITYAEQLVEELGVPRREYAARKLRESAPERYASWARDPSFRAEELPLGDDQLVRTEWNLAMEARVDAELSRGAA